jgi:hypothetical protein
MASSSRIGWILGPGVTQRGLVLSGALALMGMVLVFAPILPRASLLQTLEPPAAHRQAAVNSSWTGHLENPGISDRGAAASQKLTSASYTTGFDTADSEPLPSAPAKLAAREPDGCPKGLACAFRPRADRPSLLPPQRPQAFAEASTPPADEYRQETKQRTGLAAFLPRLPSPHALLKPFVFVANSVGGLMRRL